MIWLCLLIVPFLTSTTVSSLLLNVRSQIPDDSPVKFGNVSIWFDRIPKIDCTAFQQYVAQYMVNTQSISKDTLGKYFTAARLCGSKASPSITLHPELENKPINLLHISKASGSIFCSCGNKGGMNKGLANPSYRNCHYLQEDKPMWGFDHVPQFARIPKNDPKSSTCLELTRKFTQTYRYPITLEGNENYLPFGGYLCRQEFKYVVIIRSPIHRLFSHIFQIVGSPNRIVKQTVWSIFQTWPLLSDNYMVRSLGGNAVFRLPFGQVQEVHFNMAMSTLQQFDDVLVAGQDLVDILRTRYNWTSCIGDEGRNSGFPGGTQGIVDYFQENWAPEDWQNLTKQNTFDIELFNAGRMIEKRDSILKANSNM